MRRSLPLFAVLAVLALPSLALAQWSDNFDGYANGTSLHGVGGWAGWDNNPAATGFVTNAQCMAAISGNGGICKAKVVSPILGRSECPTRTLSRFVFI